MKRLLVLFLFTLILMSCGPAVIEIPDNAVVAVCPQVNTFKYIYKDDVVYEFYSDATFQEGVCTFSAYLPE